MTYYVFKELSKRGWILHSKFKTFFQIHGTPKVKTEEYIEGRFKFFDTEKWKINFKKEFRFEFKLIEKFD